MKSGEQMQKTPKDGRDARQIEAWRNWVSSVQADESQGRIPVRCRHLGGKALPLSCIAQPRPLGPNEAQL